MGTAAFQGDLWNSAARDWAEFIEPLFSPIYRAILAAAQVDTGQHVLDIGCGTGLFCHLATERGAVVAGIDAASKSIELAKSRTPSGDFRVGEMEELPFADSIFDLVTGFNSFQFAANPANALRQAQRVAKPTGKIAMAVFGRAQDCEAVPVIKAMSDLLPPPPPGAPGPFALSEPDVLEAMLARAGLKPERSAEVDTPYVFPGLDAACRGWIGSGPGVVALRRVGEEKLRTVLMAAFAPFKQADGSYRLENKFKYVLARP
jgi:SAM-dependent methyltransferase